MWEHRAKTPLALGLRGMALAAALLLCGCSAPMAVTALGVSAVSLYETDRTPYDHAMSWATGKDCSMRNNMAGDPYCMDIHEDEVPPDIACYNSIAAMTCYPTENPHETASQRVH